MSNGDAQTASGIAAYRMARELGSRSPRSYAAIREPNELVVLYRFARSTDAKITGTTTVTAPDGGNALSADAMTTLHRDARCLAKHWHPNIARVRHVDFEGDDLVVATELVDGATLGDLFDAAAALRTTDDSGTPDGPVLPLPILVRIFVDVAAGLSGLHGLRDEDGAPLGAIHGALCPANIAVGKDGVARTLNALRPRPPCMAVGSEVIRYAAPEALDESATQDLRADLHALGIIMWEALTGRRLYDETDPARVLARQRGEEIAPPAFPEGSPFAKLADVTKRAMAFDPSLRFKTAAEMGAALRAIAATHIAKGSAVAACVAALAGDQIRARRIELDPSASSARRLGQARAAPSAPRVADAQSAPSEGPKHDTLPPITLDPSELGPPSSESPAETVRGAIPITDTVPAFVPTKAPAVLPRPAQPAAPIAKPARLPSPASLQEAAPPAAAPPPYASVPSVIVAPDSQPALAEAAVQVPAPVRSVAPDDAYGPMVHPTPDPEAAGAPVASAPPRDRRRVAAIAVGCLLTGAIVLGLFALRASGSDVRTTSANAGNANPTNTPSASASAEFEAEAARVAAEAEAARVEAKTGETDTSNLEAREAKTEPPAGEAPSAQSTGSNPPASDVTTTSRPTTARPPAAADRPPSATPKPAAKPKRPTYEPLGI